jgi:hypothetical protein
VAVGVLGGAAVGVAVAAALQATTKRQIRTNIPNIHPFIIVPVNETPLSYVFDPSACKIFSKHYIRTLLMTVMQSYNAGCTICQ